MRNIEIETIEISGWKGAMIGMRAPMQSYGKSDTVGSNIGSADLELAQKLIKGGPEHRKFLRMIHVQAQASLTRYVWSEYDTYKIGTTSNSESTMHKLLNNTHPITEDLFFFGNDYYENSYVQQSLKDIIRELELMRKIYKKEKVTEDEKEYFSEIIKTLEIADKQTLLVLAKRILPECFVQTRVIDLNYETIRTIYHQRKNHRLKEEWQDTFCKWVETLPYFNEFIALESDLKTEIETLEKERDYWYNELKDMDSTFGHGYFDELEEED